MKVLALSGGGFRGLYSATLLRELEDKWFRRPLKEVFDVISGTSIGGIIACGLSSGIPAEKIQSAIAEHGPRIFRRKSVLSIKGILTSRYDPTPLREVIESILSFFNALKRIDMVYFNFVFFCESQRALL